MWTNTQHMHVRYNSFIKGTCAFKKTDVVFAVLQNMWRRKADTNSSVCQWTGMVKGWVRL